MDILFNVMLGLHIAGGTLALLGAPVALMARKGAGLHRKAGCIFFWGMTTVFITAVYMSIVHNIPFLFMTAFFSYQLVLSGKRALYYKKLFRGQKVETKDWAMLMVAGLVNLAMIAWGIRQYVTVGNPIGIVSFFFGLIGLVFATRDFLHFYYGTKDKQAWLFKHIGGMMGGYIGAVTAFLVVNFSDQLPTLMVWLGPSAVGSPLIAWFIASYRHQFSKGKQPAELMTIGLKKMQ